MTIKEQLTRLANLERVARAIVAEMVTVTDGRLQCLWCQSFETGEHAPGCEVAELAALVEGA